MDTMEVEVDKTSLMDVDAGTKEEPLPAEAQAEPATNEPASAAAAAAAAAAPAADPASADSTSDSDDEPAETGTSGEGGGDAGGAGKSGASSKTPEEKLVKAVGYKDKGNACIAAGDSAGALKHYERGIKIVTSLGTTDEQAGTLLLSLRLNLALACTKEQRYQDAIAAAGKVLEVDGSNVKALFRRGVARARLGSLEDAKADFLAVIKADPRNGGAKKELKLVRDRLVEHRKKEKASYGGLFDKGPMYNDKEVERKKREAEALKRLKEEEAEWGRSNEQRKADGKEEQTLEDWRKEKKEAEEKAKKEREEKEKLKPRPPPAAPPKKASSGNSSSKDGGNGGGGAGEEMELDEDDLKIIQDTKKQGYCYFKRTLSDKDQKLLDAEQMKLRARVASPATISENDKSGGAVEADAAVRSAWNNAGTWEEMEKTEWCKGKLTEAFCKVEVTAGKDARTDPEFLLEKLGGFDFASAAGEGGGAGKGLEALSQLKQTLAKLRAKVTSVEIVEGDARVICVSNKIKHIFEFNAKVKFSLSIDESMGLQPQAEGDKAAKDTKTYKGTLEFPDLTNGDVDNGKFEVEPELKWDKGARWESTYDDRVKTCVAELKAGLLSALGVFFAEYKSS